jgi:beta-lactam-binding protein with PASTA domain
MGFRKRMQRAVRTAALLFVLVSVGFLSALVAVRYTIQGREVKLPDLTGKSEAQAREQTQNLGLGFRVEDRVYSRQPAGAVVRQSPTAGTRVKVGENEHVVLSLGPQKVTIPALQDKSERAARIELLRSGMQLGQESSVYLPAEPADTVVQQDPPPGTENATSPQVNLLLSLGALPPAYVMPGLTGESIGAAEAKLAAAGLKVAKTTPANVPGAPRGIVVEQSPARGQRVDSTVPIDLQVAD